MMTDNNNVEDKSSKINYRFCKKTCYDWIKVNTNKLPDIEYAEVKFKNDRKDYYKFYRSFRLKVGDIVMVSTDKGVQDIGMISLIGEIVLLQMKKKNINTNIDDLKYIIKKCKEQEIAKWTSIIEQENQTLLKAREIIKEKNIDMKLTDVEYSGDGTLATFYYIADNRVDFRELLKIFSETFRVRIDMRQIGKRQESGKLGGLGLCGRELCCSSWINNYKSVTLEALKVQQLAQNNEKVKGLCGIFKCCINYEVDAYKEIMTQFPSEDIHLFTKKGEAIQQKIDTYRQIAFYSYVNEPNVYIAVSLQRIKKIIEMNNNKQMPEDLVEVEEVEVEKKGNDFHKLEIKTEKQFNENKKKQNNR